MDAGRSAIRVLSREREQVDAALHRVLDRSLASVDGRLAGPIRYAVEAGGKRLRPILCIAAFRAAGGGRAGDALHDAACALELIHTYSLVHDDLPCMDDDDYRRGRPTAHRTFGERDATLAGALMIPLAAGVLHEGASRLGLSPGECLETVRDLTGPAGASGMVGGQVLDLAAEGKAVSAVELEAIHSRKTGALFGASMRIGGRLARAEASVIEALTTCGFRLGLAFQVTDDVLDVTGQSAVLGKSAGRDAQQGKATYPALLGLEGARARARAEAARAVAALHYAGIQDELLEDLIAFAVNRDR